MTTWELYRSVCEALERLSLLPRYSEGLESYLSEANPDVWEGEVSADPAVYEDFRGFISAADHERLSLFGLIRLYFSTLGLQKFAPFFWRQNRASKNERNRLLLVLPQIRTQILFPL